MWNLAEFQSKQPKGGYRWEETGGVLALRPLPDSGWPEEHRTVSPFQNNADLCLRFAQLGDSREAILAFANAHGSIHARGEADLLSSWLHEIEVMGWALQTWSGLQGVARAAAGPLSASAAARMQESYKFIKKSVDVQDDLIWLKGTALWEFLSPRDEPWEKLPPEPRKGRSGAVQIARVLLARTVSARSSGVHVSIKPSGSHFERVLVARNLLSALWFQFGELLDGGIRPFFCPGCRRWKAPIAEGRKPREDRATCSNTCRWRLHNMKRKAKTLSAEGMSAAKIARSLDVHPREVREWIEG